MDSQSNDQNDPFDWLNEAYQRRDWGLVMRFVAAVFGPLLAGLALEIWGPRMPPHTGGGWMGVGGYLALIAAAIFMVSASYSRGRKIGLWGWLLALALIAWSASQIPQTVGWATLDAGTRRLAATATSLAVGLAVLLYLLFKYVAMVRVYGSRGIRISPWLHSVTITGLIMGLIALNGYRLVRAYWPGSPWEELLLVCSLLLIGAGAVGIWAQATQQRRQGRTRRASGGLLVPRWYEEQRQQTVTISRRAAVPALVGWVVWVVCWAVGFSRIRGAGMLNAALFVFGAAALIAGIVWSASLHRKGR